MNLQSTNSINMRGGRLQILLIVISSLIVLEVMARVFPPALNETPKIFDNAQTREREWIEYHSTLGWVHQLYKDAVLPTSVGQAKIHLNSQGFRGIREYTEAKPADSRRILVLGDGFAFGLGVSDDETFSHLIESSKPNLEVINMGVAGYGVDQMLLLYRILAKDYEADYVFVGISDEIFYRAMQSFSANGYAKPYFVLAEGGLALKNAPVPQPGKFRFEQYPEVVEHSPLEEVFNRSALYRILKSKLTELGRSLRVMDPDSSLEWKVGRVILKDLMNEIRSHHATPVLLILPGKSMKDGSQGALEDSLSRFAGKNNFEILDLNPVFAEACRQGGIEKFFTEGKWTPAAHVLASEEVRKYLEGKGI